MSVLDQFRDAQQRVAERLKELEPAVAEYRELEEVARRLGIDGEASRGKAGAAASATRRPSRKTAAATTKRASAPTKPDTRTKRSRGSRRTTASPGQRAEQLLALVRERPGVTVAEAGKHLGVDPTGLYRIVHRLEQRGDVRKNGRQLEPATSGG
jgi:transcriptional regulator with GAF, ATPase, and Fis domain